MESLIFLIFLVSLTVVFRVIFINRNKQSTFPKTNVYNKTYSYTSKYSLMTSTEAEFYKKLYMIVKDRYFIFPQVHLSAIADHKVKGQNWKGAFSHINGKSVDYVLCDIKTMRPIYAIELDDYSHDLGERKYRDNEVERIFRQIGIPLVRFRDTRSLSLQDIANKLANAKQNNEL